MSGRLIVVGIDGASYDLVTKLAAEGALPNLRRLIQEGALMPMVSSLPEVSPVAWNSIITGADPAEHGVFGFTDLAPGSYRTTFASSHVRAVPPFWERDSNGRAIVVNVPFTYPAQPMNGTLIAGFVALSLEKATYPSSLVPDLRKSGYRIDVDSGKAHQSLELFMRDLDRTLRGRIAVYRHLWETEPWQTFVLVFTGTDRLSHFLWDAYQDPGHVYHEAFIDLFCQVDAIVGEIADRLQPKDTLLVVSDHGFERLEKDVYVNALLGEAGLLCFERATPRGLRDIASKARAFALEPSRIYVHTERYPKGTISEAERELVLDEVEDLFYGLTFEGRPVIKRAYRNEDIYCGPLLDRAPDLVLLAEAGFNLRSGLRARQAFGTDIFTGKHARDNAILLAYGGLGLDGVPGRPCVADVVQVMERMTGRFPEAGRQ